MFTVKGLKKEDLVIVATELGLKVDPDHRIGDLKALIELSEQYGKDFDFVKEFLVTTVSDRIQKEKQEEETLKNEKEYINLLTAAG